ncbi:MAG TPA: MFS transporter [Caulobacteraceae bacterium]
MTAVSPARPRSIVQVALTACAGSTIEWYDFFIYGTAAALVFPKLFFPPDLPPYVAQIAAFSTFAVGFIARPIGGLLFGQFGDLFGRKRALVAALVLMGLGTASIGLMPTYAQWGIAAPIVLVVLRFLQGLAVGGQWGGAALLAIESAPAKRRGFYGSFVQIGVPLGVILANLVFLGVGAATTTQDFATWGWRIPFLLSVALVVIGLYVQLNLEESADFDEAQAKRKAGEKSRVRMPIVAVLVNHPKEILLAGGAFLANNTSFYIAITYVVAYGVGNLHLPKSLLLSSIMIASAVMTPVLILCGWISDHWGRLPLFILGAALTTAFALAFFPLLDTGVPRNVFIAIAVELFLLSLMYGPQAALFAELFPVELRYSGASIGYQLGAVLGGGLAPIIATALYARFHSSTAIGIYLFAMCFISLVSALLLRGRKARADRATQAAALPN